MGGFQSKNDQKPVDLVDWLETEDHNNENTFLDNNEEDHRDHQHQLSFSNRNLKDGVATVKRYTPSKAILRNRVFKVYLAITLTDKEQFLIQLVNDPKCEIQLSTMKHSLLKSVPISRIVCIQKNEFRSSVEVIFRAKNITENQSYYSMKATFETADDVSSFCDSFMLLFGKRIYSYGELNEYLCNTTSCTLDRLLSVHDIAAAQPGSRASKISSNMQREIEVLAGDEDSDDFSPLGMQDEIIETRNRRNTTRLSAALLTTCPLHGSSSAGCQCKIERPLIVDPVEYGFTDSSDTEDINDVYENTLNSDNATNLKNVLSADSFPFTLAGSIESENTVTCKELATAGRKYAPMTTSWYLSELPGKEPIFSTRPYLNGQVTMTISDYAVGRFIKVVRTRRIEENTFIYTETAAGPITVCNATALRMLQILLSSYAASKPVMGHLSGSSLHSLIRVPVDAIQKIPRPLYDVYISVNVHGLLLRAEVDRQPYGRFLRWNEFTVLRKDYEFLFKNDRSGQLEIYLLCQKHNFRIVFCSNSGEPDYFSIMFENVFERNAVYHTLAFCKLIKSFKRANEWINCLKQNRLSPFKQEYSKAWGSTDFNTFRKIENMVKLSSRSLSQNRSSVPIPDSRFGSSTSRSYV